MTGPPAGMKAFPGARRLPGLLREELASLSPDYTAGSSKGGRPLGPRRSRLTGSHPGQVRERWPKGFLHVERLPP